MEKWKEYSVKAVIKVTIWFF